MSNYARLNKNSLAGTNYIALHELAHMTAAGRANNQAHGGQPDHSPGWKKNESLANDVAHALLGHAGLPTLPIGEKQGGLSNPPPQVTLPSPPGGGGGGGHDHQVIH
ncbi:MAG: hypothetical protein Q4B94_01010 [Pseudomonadota bacterium]|nr:hypothetical protein [Pseudomonadota bacterium]